MKKKTAYTAALLLLGALLLCSFAACTKEEPVKPEEPSPFPELDLTEEMMKKIEADREYGYHADAPDKTVGPDTPVLQ